MKFIENRANKIFLKACANLCEIENVKEYDTDMNVKSEYKIIKLKDSVLKEHIANIAKESSVNMKSSNNNSRKDLNLFQSQKSGSQTARVRGSTDRNSASQQKKDSFLISSLVSAQTFFPKPNRNIILMIMDKMVDKYCNSNFENWASSNKDSEDSDIESQ